MWTQDFKGFYPTYPLLVHFMLLTSVLSRNYLQKTNKKTNKPRTKKKHRERTRLYITFVLVKQKNCNNTFMIFSLKSLN